MSTKDLSYKHQETIPISILPKACGTYSRNIYISATVELTNKDPSLSLHKLFLGFNLTHKNILLTTDLCSLLT